MKRFEALMLGMISVFFLLSAYVIIDTIVHMPGKEISQPDCTEIHKLDSSPKRCP